MQILEGMDDFLVVHHSHPFIMLSGEVIDRVLHFPQNGYFKRDNL